MCGEYPKDHLKNGFLTARELPVPSPFLLGYEAYATGSDSGWGGSLVPDNPNRGQGAWVSPPPGATDRDNLGRAGHPCGGGASRVSGISTVHPNQSQRLGRVLPIGGGGGGGTGGAGGGGGSGPGGGGSSSSPGLGARGSPNVDLPAII